MFTAVNEFIRKFAVLSFGIGLGLVVWGVVLPRIINGEMALPPLWFVTIGCAGWLGTLIAAYRVGFLRGRYAVGH